MQLAEEKNGWVKKLPFLEIFLVSVVSLVIQACCFPLTAVGTQHSFYTSLGEAFGHPFQPTCKLSHRLRLFYLL